jgi:hypothetical protein
MVPWKMEAPKPGDPRPHAYISLSYPSSLREDQGRKREGRQHLRNTSSVNTSSIFIDQLLLPISGGEN